MSAADVPLRGRFAPTPSGPLHLGSLLTALASFLQARRGGGAWLLRIDDLDAPRVAPGAIATILRQLEAHGLHWDETPRYQSRHIDEYEAAFARLRDTGVLYPCACTRAQLALTCREGPDGPVYAGTCRGRALAGERLAWRLAVGTGVVALEDPWQGRLEREVARDIGDFTVRRSDGQIGYQLACVVDEAAQAIGEVVRGADLVGSSLRQQLLQWRLGLPHPRYRHLPVLVDAQGRKLSKQNHAAPLDERRAAGNLVDCLRWLGQSPPAGLDGATVREVIDWSLAHWSAARVPHQPTQVVP